jgi:uncharacterized repeat protein (TIGR01451 family)
MLMAALVACALRVDAAPVLTLGKAGGGTVNSGDTAVFVLTLTNVGDAFATGIVIADALPTPFAWMTSTSGCSINGTTKILTCSVGTLPPSGAFVAVTTALVTATTCGTFENTAGATSSNANAPSSNTVMLHTTCPALNVRQAVDDFRPMPGEVIGFRMAVVNDGDGLAKSVTLTDLLPSALQWSLRPATPGCSVDGDGQLICAFGDLKPNEARAVHVTTAAPPFTCGEIASAPQATSSNGADDSASSHITVAIPGDVNLSCTVDLADVFYLLNFLFANGPFPQ